MRSREHGRSAAAGARSDRYRVRPTHRQAFRGQTTAGKMHPLVMRRRHPSDRIRRRRNGCRPNRCRANEQGANRRRHRPALLAPTTNPAESAAPAGASVPSQADAAKPSQPAVQSPDSTAASTPTSRAATTHAQSERASEPTAFSRRVNRGRRAGCQASRGFRYRRSCSRTATAETGLAGGRNVRIRSDQGCRQEHRIRRVRSVRRDLRRTPSKGAQTIDRTRRHVCFRRR